MFQASPTRFYLLCLLGIFVHISLQKAAAQHPVFSRWKHIVIDSTRVPMQGKPTGAWCFGLDAGDINGDRFPDIAAGKWVYLHPGKTSSGWHKLELPLEADAVFVVKRKGKQAAGIFALRCNEQYWLQLSKKGEWDQTRIGTFPICDHGISSQGVARGNIFTKGSVDLFIKNTAGDVYCFSVPAKFASPWKATLLIPGTGHEKGLAVADIDGDGLQDIVTAGKEKDNLYTLLWYKNVLPGTRA